MTKKVTASKWTRWQIAKRKCGAVSREEFKWRTLETNPRDQRIQGIRWVVKQEVAGDVSLEASTFYPVFFDP